MNDINRVRAGNRRFADNEDKGHSDYYFKLFHAEANDSWLIDVIAQMPVIRPNLVLVSLHLPHRTGKPASDRRKEAGIGAGKNGRDRVVDEVATTTLKHWRHMAV